MAEPSIANYLERDERGLQFPMSQQDFASLTPTTQANVLRAMSQEKLDVSNYITDSKMSAVTSKAPKKEVYVSSGGGSKVDPQTGDQYSLTGYGMQQLEARRRKQGLPPLISLEEYQSRRKEANKNLAKEVTDELPEGAELMIPAAEKAVKKAEVEEVEMPMPEKRPTPAPKKDPAMARELKKSTDEFPPTKEEATEDMPEVSAEMRKMMSEPMDTSSEDMEEDPTSFADRAFAPDVDMPNEPMDTSSEDDFDDDPTSFRGAEDGMSDTSRAVFADDEVEGTAQEEAVKRQLEDIDIAKMEAEADKQANPEIKTDMKVEDAIPFYNALFPDAPFGSNPTEQQQNLMSDLMKALASLPEGTPLSEAIKSPELAKAISEAARKRVSI
tara:strand:- start:3305 stop:4459 length:1155 start_codon:yes stop_codon:yes gene_type:complete